MTICVSPGGPTVYQTESPSNEILFGTSDGIARLTRLAVGEPWTLSGRMLPGKHVNALARDPKTGALFAGTSQDGVFVSLDGGGSWDQRNDGLVSNEIYTLHAVQYPEGLRLYAGTEPAYLFASDDLGQTWQELTGVRSSAASLPEWSFPGPKATAHVKGLAFDPRSADVIYAAIEVGTLMKSEDRGKTWRELHGFEADVHRIAISPAQPDLVYMTNGGGVWRSYDAGDNWERMTDRTSRMRYPDCMVVDPVHPERLFVTSAGSPPPAWAKDGTTNCMVGYSGDAGSNWEYIERGLPSHIRGNIEGMSTEIYPGGRTLVTGNLEGEVFYSADGGESWTTVATDIGHVSKGGHYRGLMRASMA